MIGLWHSTVNQTSAALDQAEHALRLSGVSRSFVPGRPLLKNIDLVAAAGERIALQGESGVGKSTLLNVIAGIERPTSGEVWVGATPVPTLSEGAMAAFRKACSPMR